MVTGLRPSSVEVMRKYPLTKKTQIRSQGSRCGICGDEVALGRGFIRVLQSSLLSSHSPLLLIHIYSSIVDAV